MKIALYAYGSIANNLTSPNYGGKGVSVTTAFAPAGVKLPLSFSRISSQGTPQERITLVPDMEGTGRKTPLFFATMAETHLSSALKELKAREGMHAKKFVSYIRKGTPSHSNSAYKCILVEGELWSYRVNGITDAKVQKMIRHLKRGNFDVGIIATFEKKGGPPLQLTEYLNTHPDTIENTKGYFASLHEDVKKVHRDALREMGVLV